MSKRGATSTENRIAKRTKKNNNVNFERGKPFPIAVTTDEISRQLRNWNIQTFQGGIITTSQDSFEFGKQKIQAPDISFTPNASLGKDQLWSFEDGEPFTPIFVIEVVNITSESKFKNLDNKFKNDYFALGTSVKLGWLIDPKNRNIWIYKLNKRNKVYRRRRPHGWGDVGGGNILSGFTLDVLKIENIISQKSKELREREREEEKRSNKKNNEGSEESENENEGSKGKDGPCSYCGEIFADIYSLIKHIEKRHAKSDKREKN